MLPPRSPARPDSRRRGLARTACALAAGVFLGVVAGCSTSDCKSMKGNGSILGDLVCGGQGTDAPEPNAPAANACSDVRQVMPGFFRLLADPAKPLDGLRQAVKQLGAPVCADRDPPKSCTPNDLCPVGDCQADGKCPCQHPTSALGDLLVIVFKGLSSVSSDKIEPGAPAGARCVSAVLARDLPPAQLNRMCELRRTLDVLLQQNGGQTLLTDPNVQRVVLSLLQYVEGKKDGTPHYDLFTTLGRMAQNPAICSPTDAYDVLDKALAYYTPQKAAADLGAIQTLLADPITKNFLKGLSDGNGSVKGRAAVILLAHDLIGAVTSAASGPDATAQIDSLLNKIVYPYIEQNFGTAYEAEVKAAVAALEGPLAPSTGIFPLAKSLLTCVNNPIIDHDGELVGALYDLISLQSSNGSGIDLATLVGAIKTLVTLDQTGQVSRSLRLILQAARDDDAATQAVRGLLAQTLTPELGKELLPALDVLVQNQVLGEVFTLLDDLLYSCNPPKAH